LTRGGWCFRKGQERRGFPTTREHLWDRGLKILPSPVPVVADPHGCCAASSRVLRGMWSATGVQRDSLASKSLKSQTKLVEAAGIEPDCPQSTN
jgi:hypothetical protein